MSEYVTRDEFKKLIAGITEVTEPLIIEIQVIGSLAFAALIEHPNLKSAIERLEEMQEAGTVPLLYSPGVKDAQIEKVQKRFQECITRLRTALGQNPSIKQ